jgi:HD-GYP domain-containing protein (c-di-GMP phosphodiesterase class II)
LRTAGRQHGRLNPGACRPAVRFARRMQVAPPSEKARSGLNPGPAAADLYRVNSLAPAEPVRVSELLAALSLGLDLAEGQPMGHALRSCLVGMRLADRLGLPVFESRTLYFTLLAQSLGAPGCGPRLRAALGGDDRAALRDLRRVDWSCDLQALRWATTHAAADERAFGRWRRVASLVPTGREALSELFRDVSKRGAAAAERLGLGARVAEAVGALDEHWDGSGQPAGLSGSGIPLIARIASLSRTLDTLTMAVGPRRALAYVRSRRGRWFDPTLVAACEGLESELAQGRDSDEAALRLAVREGEPGSASLLAGQGTLSRYAAVYADLIDSHSAFRIGHSPRVAGMAVVMARHLGWNAGALDRLWCAALLHDIGLFSVPTAILDSPHPLAADAWEAVRLHPYYSRRILEPIPGFADIAEAAAAHHERLDGRGYFRGLRGAQVSPAARLLAVADIYDALTTERPFRAALEPERALTLMRRDRGVGLCPDAMDALAEVMEPGELRRAA